MLYIIRSDSDGNRETVDEFETLKEARRVVVEYAISDPWGRYWISRKTVATHSTPSDP